MRTVGSVGDETARNIRRCAVDLIAEHGFEAMSLRQLADRVGITAGSLYNYIGSKQDLLSGLLQAVMEDLLAAVDSGVLVHRSPLMQFRAFVQLHVQFHVDRKNDVLIATTELRSLTTDNLRKIVKLRNRYEATLVQILKRGCAAREFTVGDTKLAALALIPMLTGVSQWYRPGGRLSRDALVEGYVAICLALVGVPKTKGIALPEITDTLTEEPPRLADFGAKRRRTGYSRGN